MICDFNTPKTFNGDSPATSTDFWQYSQMECSSTQSILIENTSTGASFYIKKSISYGDFLVITFFLIFLIFAITKFLIDFLIPKKIDLRKQ